MAAWNKMSQETFIKLCKEKFGEDYDLSLVNYENQKSRIKVICNNCGKTFEISAYHFLHEKKCGGCKHCQKNLLRQQFSITTEEFVKKAKEVHGDKYDYSKSEYVNMHTPICIVCKEHGEFWRRPQEHLKGYGCHVCALLDPKGRVGKITTEDFIFVSKKVHNNKYDYSKSKYVSAKSLVCIICPKHGEFWQQAFIHMRGCGCPRCKRSLGEEKTKKYLTENNIRFIEQYKIKNDNEICKNINFYVDFFLPNHNTIIEYNGQQHYCVTGFGDKDLKLKQTQERDNSLREHCKAHGIKLVEIPYTDFDRIEEILDKQLNIKNENNK